MHFCKGNSNFVMSRSLQPDWVKKNFFPTLVIWSDRNHCLKNLKSKSYRCKYIGIRKLGLESSDLFLFDQLVCILYYEIFYQLLVTGLLNHSNSSSHVFM